MADNAITAPRAEVSIESEQREAEPDIFIAQRNGGTVVKGDAAQATQDLVNQGKVTALEIAPPDAATLAENGRQIEQRQSTLGRQEQFNGMIRQDGATVFGAPKRGGQNFFGDVDGRDDPGFFWNGKDGVITKKGIDQFTAEADAEPKGRFRNPPKEAYVAALKNFSQNWDSPDMAPYKDAQGNMTKESFAAGMTTLPDREKQVTEGKATVAQQAEQLRKDTAALAESTKVTTPEPKPEQKPEQEPVKEPEQKVEPTPEQKPEAQPEVKPEVKPEAKPEATTEVPAKPELTEDAAKRAEVAKGEGPYQVAARILAADGQKHDHKEVMILTRALQAQYREEKPADQSMASLKVKHQLLTPENAQKVLDRITDTKLKEKLQAQIFKPAPSA